MSSAAPTACCWPGLPASALSRVPTMKEVSRGVFEVPVLRGFVNVYLVIGETVAVVDAGLPGRSSEVCAAVQRAGRATGDVSAIAMTHHHIDHSGALASLQAKTGAQVYASAF